MNYDSVAIIYNPKSTGNSAKNAKKLKTQLTKMHPELKVNLHKTEHAGHAEALAYEASGSSDNPLIISSSGDGGYNEVINGAMKAQAEGANPVCAVLASGNANDHSRTLQKGSLLSLIKANKMKKIDLLKITIKQGDKTKERYAHSYIGLGITPNVADELNKTDLNGINELLIVFRTIYKHTPFRMNKNGKDHKLDSLIFTNIGIMAKVLRVSKSSKPDDGLFEYISFEYANKTKLLGKIVKATTGGFNNVKQSKSYKFTVLDSVPIQLDGEVMRIQKDSSVRVTCEHHLLRTLI